MKYPQPAGRLHILLKENAGGTGSEGQAVIMWKDGKRGFSILNVHIQSDVSREDEIIVMKTTGDKGAFMVAAQHRSVTRRHNSSQVAVRKRTAV